MEPITNHAERALSRLAQEFRDIPELDALIRIFCQQVQDIEDAAHALQLARTLDAATGELLEFFGRIVGEKRNGALDAPFRRRVRARVLLNKGSGTRPQLLAIFRALLPPPYTLELVDYYPAATILTVAGAGLEVAGELAGILHEAKAAGVKVVLRYQPEVDATTFTLADVTGTPAGAGLGDATDPGVGGSLAGAIT